MEKPAEPAKPSSEDKTAPLTSSPNLKISFYPGLILADVLRLERLVGKGGMGEVWLATHLLLNELRAVKVIITAHSADPQFRERFIYGEARNALRLNHLNIVRTYDLGQFRDAPYIVMEYVEGNDLKSLLKARGRFTPQETGAILTQLASALDTAHRQGLIHRDLKPANILLTDAGVVKITDFGLVKDLTLERSDLTLNSYGLGTPLYMAPEQSQGRAEVATDIYALGIMLYEMLSGFVPFSGTAQSLLIQHATALPTPLNALNPAIPPVLSAVVMQALAKNPAERFASALAFSEAYQRALGGSFVDVTTPLEYSKPVRTHDAITNSALDWSYERLEVGEKLLFVRLAIFVEGWTLKSAAVVCNDLAIDLQAGLTLLVSNSLVMQQRDANGEIRFAMLPNIREYALEKLSAEEKGRLAAQHAAYFLTLVEELEPKLSGSEQAKTLMILDSEYANIKAALEWLLNQVAIDKAVRLARGLAKFWRNQGYYSEGKGYLERVLALLGEGATAQRAATINTLARLTRAQGDYARSQELYAETLKIYRELDYRPAIATSLNILSQVANLQEDYSRMRGLLEESLQIYRELGDNRNIATTLNNLSWLAQQQNDLGSNN